MEAAQKTSNPPPMTPSRTAPPVARRLAERPAAPPLPVLVLVGDEVTEDRLLAREEEREDMREETLLATLERIEDKVDEGLTEEAGGRTKSTCMKINQREMQRTGAAEGILKSLGILDVVSGTAGLETLKNGRLILRVDANARSVGAVRDD